MIIYLRNGVIEWAHEDITIKEREEFKDDPCCIVTPENFELPSIPNDSYNYHCNWNGDISKMELIRGEKIELPHEEITKMTNQQTSLNAEDNLINMELCTDTNTKVTTTGDDSLLLMEMLVAIDEKLTQLLNSKQF